MREVAREVGVTHAAAYHHFASKEALAAVAEQGFLERLLTAVDQEPVPVANPFFAVIAVAIGYARYAVRNPSQFRFMYGTSPASTSPWCHTTRVR